AREGARAREASVHLDRVVLLAPGVEAELDVAFADDPARFGRPQRGLAEHLVLEVGKRLARGDDDVIPGVDAHPEDVLHVADRERIPPSVADDLVLELLELAHVPFEKELTDGARPQPADDDVAELLFGPGDPSSSAAEGEGDPDHNREPERLHRLERLWVGVDRP